MFKSKKAQAAMEFLMTYGWALLVVLIAIAALAFFGLLNPSRFLPEKCTVPPGFGCGGYAAATTNFAVSPSSSANLTFFLTNGMGEALYDLHINIPECKNLTKAYISVEGGAYSNLTTGVNVPEGSTAQVAYNCTNANSLTQGDRFRGTLNITYKTRFENIMTTRTKSGDIIVAVQ